jgi:hypothetical protein
MDRIQAEREYTEEGAVLLCRFRLNGYCEFFIHKSGNEFRIRESTYKKLVDKYKDKSEFKETHGGLTRHTYKLIK